MNNKDFQKLIRKILFFEVFPLAVVLILIYKYASDFMVIKKGIGILTTLLKPFIWGFAIAYLLNPLFNLFHKKYKIGKKISLIAVYFITIICVYLVVLVTIPTIESSVTDITKTIENFDIEKVKSNLVEKVGNKEIVIEFVDSIANVFINKTGENFDFNSWLSKFGTGVSSLTIKIYVFTKEIFTFIIGFILSIYMLYDKEKFKVGIDKVLKCFLKKQQYDSVISLAKDIDFIFSKFLIGKALDSLIIGIICYVGLLILHIRYAAFLSLIVGITNMIPYFGPFIGAVPVIFITFLYSPILSLISAIFILILQQFDGYVLGPAILGESVGVDAFWIIFAIVIFGGLFGVLGMLIGVPIVAILKDMISKYLDKRLLEINKIEGKK